MSGLYMTDAVKEK